jgi:iron(III) transport system substrate-binding protein
MNVLHRAVRIGALAALAALLASAAHADGPALATYQGADRLARLVEAAKREGELTIYTSTPVDDIKVMTDAFERKYGVRAKVWRASSEKVLQRGVCRGARQPVRRRRVRDQRAGARSAGAGKVADARLVAVAGVARARSEVRPPIVGRHAVADLRDRVQHEPGAQVDLPASYEGFADAKWKGKLAIEAEDSDWFATVSGLLGEAKRSRSFAASSPPTASRCARDTRC